MIIIDLPENPSVEYMSYIPSQRDIINKLMFDGVISGVSLIENRNKLWITINSENEDGVIDILNTFPMIKFMRFKIEKLLFHFTSSNVFPQMSLN